MGSVVVRAGSEVAASCSARFPCYRENIARQVRDNMKKPNPKPRPKATGTLIGVRLQEPELAAVDGWRKKQADIPTRPEAIRRLLGKALGKK